jgi:short-subunit dehydrogenase
VVTLVGRRSEPLDLLAKDLTSAGATAHVITADLSDTGATPRLAEQIRAQAGHLDAFYYAPTPNTGFVSAANLTPQLAQNFMPLIFYTMLALVQEFLPHMLEQGDGAILTAQGGSTVQGLPNMSGPSPAQAAQRNYLQALHAEVAGKGVYVGMLYIGAAIKNSAFHTEMEKAKAAGDPVWEMPTVDPEHLAELLWTMHHAKEPREAIYPPRRLRDPPQTKAEELPSLHGRVHFGGTTHARPARAVPARVSRDRGDSASSDGAAHRLASREHRIRIYRRAVTGLGRLRLVA